MNIFTNLFNLEISFYLNKLFNNVFNYNLKIKKPTIFKKYYKL